MSALRLRFLGPVVLIALCLVSLCAVTAGSLLNQHATVTGVLRENVQSRRAAVTLEECLTDLIALEDDRVETVAVLHDRIRLLLEGIEFAADQPEERDFHARIAAGFAAYLKAWQAAAEVGLPGHEAARNEATRRLEADVLKPCQALKFYNVSRIEEAADNLERILRRLAWGMAAIGGLGGGAGLVLGFGVARSLGQSLRRLRVQIRDAAGKLGADLPEIVLTGEGDFQGLHVELDNLSGRIEKVVEALQQRETEVLRSKQLAAVGQLAAGVGHELRNPLTSIKMLVQAGMEDGGGGLAGDDLRIIESEIRRMERSLQTYLDFARPPVAERRPTDLVPLARGVFDLIRGRAEKQKITLTATLPDAAVVINGDADQIKQVFVNLCLNALDAMPAGGKLGLTLKVEKQRARIEVADTGPGISDAMLPRLFEPFASGKDTGLGLGLVICKRIVEYHAGTIAAANRVGGGASFYVNLPVAEAAAGKEASGAQTAGR